MPLFASKIERITVLNGLQVEKRNRNIALGQFGISLGPFRFHYPSKLLSAYQTKTKRQASIQHLSLRLVRRQDLNYYTIQNA